ncbi:bifunctional phosphoribosylaminoimidazolecarboxamide formyltransferase/IMP cyclohydrolase [Rhodothalassium salexigens]|uniref:bifunctional phosphoribosylaminoimidazolecarboxamide formyltransferase/IMP cyclohydrolase n=1 Tax=Rhodothalassium salexigens TaxID=1086 RepID=UPI001A926158|nr:bifunctional phosphoribosylaminoimidazolecarboxamide formyltransferase/IMP cyclohydrolase [Rhodothalassium salexigens]MBK5912268.1 bifunctional phosphoribosylaminoimidazolecarboxamide formyltransferase/IMP cyclohydrolase [Rhodothalassium salexigens]
MPDLLPIRRALLSMSDKQGLVPFAQILARFGVELVSTGGTARALREAGLTVTDVSEVTGFPEIMDGRVKTLHPLVHGGLLGRRDLPEHRAAMETHNITGIDLVAITLYPFEETVARGADFDETVENIDIGGPAMIRSAAKNHAFVTVITDAADYDRVAGALDAQSGQVDAALRRALAAKAFRRTAAYDARIAQWFTGEVGETDPERLTWTAERAQSLRYGENPHQAAAFYTTGDRRASLATAEQVQGKELSYNNLNDADAAFSLVSDFGTERPTVAIIKHANPCGVAQADSLADAYARALKCDPVSAFGGIVATNQTLDAATAEAITRIFTEVIICPDADAEARAVVAGKKNVRLLLTGGLAAPRDSDRLVRSLAGGFLVQGWDNARTVADELKVVTKRAPSAAEMADLLFAFAVCKHVKSNAIVYARDAMTVGIGAGQMNRLDSSRIAAIRAAEAAETAGEAASLAKGSVVASDAFFPFPDGMLAAAEAGATAVIQPGGAMRDDAVIEAADAAGLAMVFTGRRHFRH